MLDEVSESCFVGLALRGGIGLFCVYLPDSGKTDFAFETAVSWLQSGVSHLLHKWNFKHQVIAGDFNVEFI